MCKFFCASFIGKLLSVIEILTTTVVTAAASVAVTFFVMNNNKRLERLEEAIEVFKNDTVDVVNDLTAAVNKHEGILEILSGDNEPANPIGFVTNIERDDDD